jgi:hypothetical protein
VTPCRTIPPRQIEVAFLHLQTPEGGDRWCSSTNGPLDQAIPRDRHGPPKDNPQNLSRAIHSCGLSVFVQQPREAYSCEVNNMRQT